MPFCVFKKSQVTKTAPVTGNYRLFLCFYFVITKSRFEQTTKHIFLHKRSYHLPIVVSYFLIHLLAITQPEVIYNH